MDEEITELNPTWIIVGAVLLVLAAVAVTLLFANKQEIPACSPCPACNPSLVCYGSNITINITCPASIIQINTTVQPNITTGKQFYVSISEGMSMEANG